MIRVIVPCVRKISNTYVSQKNKLAILNLLLLPMVYHLVVYYLVTVFVGISHSRKAYKSFFFKCKLCALNTELCCLVEGHTPELGMNTVCLYFCGDRLEVKTPICATFIGIKFGPPTTTESFYHTSRSTLFFCGKKKAMVQ